MIITILVTIYLTATYFIGYNWFAKGGGEGWIKYVFLAIAPITVPFYLVLMFLFMGLGSDD